MSNPGIRPGSDEEWEALLHQLRQQPKARPQPFFYARVHTRLAARLRPAAAWLPAWVRLPAYAALLGALVLTVSRDGATSHPVAAASRYDGTRPATRPLP